MHAETVVKYIGICVAVVVAIVAIAVGVLQQYSKQFQVNPASLSERGLTCNRFPDLCSIKDGRAPDSLTVGRWKKAALMPNAGNEGALQFKSWAYVSFTDEKYFVGAAFVKFFYLSDIFLYVVDRSTHKQWTYTARLPFGVGLDSSYSSANGCTNWGVKRDDVASGKSGWMSLCSSEKGLHFRGRVPLADEKDPRIGMIGGFDVRMKSFDDLALVFPAGGDDKRLTYIHKAAGMPVANGSFILLDKKRHFLQNASAGLDWTKGRLLYRTFWRWVSINDGKAKVTRGDKPARVEYFGINLSEEVYDVLKPNGDVFSAENAVWLMGRLYILNNPIAIKVPSDPRTGIWAIQSKNPNDDENVDIAFRPFGARADNTSMGFILSDFIQPYGRFSGTITIKDPDSKEKITINLSAATSFGVVEDHKAFW